jgi:hypothetical protein
MPISALEMDTETPSGYLLDGLLWVPIIVEDCPRARRVSVCMAAYKDRAAIDAGLQPVASRPAYELTGEAYAKWEALTVAELVGRTGGTTRTWGDVRDAAAIRLVRSIEDIEIEPERFEPAEIDPETGAELSPARHVPAVRRSFFESAKAV